MLLKQVGLVGQWWLEVKTTKTHGKNQKQFQRDGPPKCSEFLNKYSECECVERKGMDDSIDRCSLRDAYVPVERVKASGPRGAGGLESNPSFVNTEHL